LKRVKINWEEKFQRVISCRDENDAVNFFLKRFEKSCFMVFEDVAIVVILKRFPFVKLMTILCVFLYESQAILTGNN
jgi:hypothetical protein